MKREKYNKPYYAGCHGINDVFNFIFPYKNNWISILINYSNFNIIGIGEKKLGRIDIIVFFF